MAVQNVSHWLTSALETDNTSMVHSDFSTSILSYHPRIKRHDSQLHFNSNLEFIYQKLNNAIVFAFHYQNGKCPGSVEKNV